MSHKISTIINTFLKEKRGSLVLYSILLLSFPISEVVMPHFYGKIIDKVSKQESIASDTKIVVGLWSLVLLLNLCANYLDSKFKPELKSYIRKNIVLNVLEKFKECYKEQQVGDLIAKIIKLPTVINDICHQMRNYIVPITLICIFAFGYFSYIDPQLGFVFLGIILALSFILWFFIRTCINHAQKMDEHSDKLHEEVGDVLENLANIYAASSCEEELKRIETYNAKSNEKYTATIRCAANFNLIFSISYLVLLFGMNYYSFLLCKRGKIKLNQLSSIMIITLYIITHLKGATSEINDFVFNIGVVNKTQSFLDELFTMEKEAKSKGDSIDIQKGEIKVENVYLKYPNANKNIFEGLNLFIPAKQSVAIMGKIGSGKTSFIRMLLKFHKHQKGDIYIDGQNIKDVNPDQLRKQIMYVPQHPVPFNRSLYENIAYGTSASKEDVKNMLQRIGLENLFPLDLDESVGKHGEKLSGGQKQVIFLLRCLLRDTHIIILDEPTSALDQYSKNYILAILQELMKNKTVLIITHDPDIVRFTNRKLTFDKGTVQ